MVFVNVQFSRWQLGTFLLSITIKCLWYGLCPHIWQASLQVSLLCPVWLQLEHDTWNIFCLFAPKSDRCSKRFCFSMSCWRAASPRWQVDRKKFFVVLWLSFSNPCWVNGRMLPWTCMNSCTWFIMACMYGVTLSDWYTSTKSLPHCLALLSNSSIALAI